MARWTRRGFLAATASTVEFASPDSQPSAPPSPELETMVKQKVSHLRCLARGLMNLGGMSDTRGG